MSVEPKRGCGFRKVHGLYIVGGGIGVPCDRLPLALEICPCCGQGIKQGMGWTWVDVAKLVQGTHRVSVPVPQDYLPQDINGQQDCPEAERCYFCGNPESMGKAGLLWVGEKFYPTPEHFVSEGVSLGFSKRIRAIPHDFKIGETYILLAHPKAVSYVNENKEIGFKPGVFYVWKPQRIEKIMLESERGSEEVEKMEKRGIFPVFVPDSDKDHQGSVYDKEETEK